MSFTLLLKNLKSALWLKVMGVTLLLSFTAVFGGEAGVSEAADAFRIDQKEEAYIGCEVLLSLEGPEAGVQDASYEWAFDGNARPIILRREGLECRFTPFDTNPIAASVSAYGPDGKFLASADIELSAKEFTVDIIMIEPEPIMLWDTAVKQEAEADGLVAGEPVQFTVALEPAYENEILCRWHTDASTAIRGGEDDLQVTMVRNEIGDAELSVVVRDKNGLVLGRGGKVINVPISRSRVEESGRRKRAWMQWTEALSQWDARDYDSAIAGARTAAEIDPETFEITDGLETMSANYTRVTRSRKFLEDAGVLQKDQNLVEALKVYRRSYAAWPLEETAGIIKELEAEVDKIRVTRQQAEWLKDTASGYDQEGLFEDALRYYKESVVLQPDDAVSQRADRIERRLASIASATALADEGRKLESEGKLTEALEKYEDSLEFENDADLAAHSQELENVIRDRRAMATTLRREAADLQRRNNDAEALLRYRESQALWHDPDTDSRIADLERTVTEEPQQAARTAEAFGIGTQADAARLLQEGHTLYKEGRYRDALDIYRQSYSISNEQHLANWIGRVENSLREYEAVIQANVLIKEANDLYDTEKYPEALERYKESLSIHANPEVENFIKFLEGKLESADVAPAAGQ